MTTSDQGKKVLIGRAMIRGHQPKERKKVVTHQKEANN